ncbi:MAG: extracellular solute-binding protein [Lentisphaerota bacterium]
MNGIFAKFKNLLGFGILILSFLASAIYVFINDSTKRDESVTRIRFCHWNLEAASAFDAVIRDFQQDYFKKTGKKVVVEQIAIPYTGYSEYTNTGLIGKTAPDIIQIGCSGTLANVNNIARYFIPLGEIILKPNPWNEGTPLQGLPWKDTFTDGMQGSLEPGFQEYYRISVSYQTVRIFYNKNLLRKISGTDKFPGEYGDFLELCRKVVKYSETAEVKTVPVAACFFQKEMFKGAYASAFTQDLIRKTDFNFDASADSLECYNHYGKDWAFDSEQLKDSLDCTIEVVKYFMPGWMAAARDDMSFAFVQQRALMTITWGQDGKMFLDQINGAFDVGVCDVPLPFKHPKYSRFVKSSANEVAIPSGSPMSIINFTKHPEECISFLQYLTTARANSKFNSLVCWLPVVKGAAIENEWLKGFLPKMEGHTGGLNYKNWQVGTQFSMVSEGLEGQLFSGKLSTAQYLASVKDAYDVFSAQNFADDIDRKSRDLRSFECFNTVNLLISNIGNRQQEKVSSSKVPSLNWATEKQIWEINSHLEMNRRNREGGKK